MPLYVADYLADTAHLGALESGAYLHLIMHYWLKGSLPNDPIQLAKISRVSYKQFNRLIPILSPFFGPGWTHKRIDQELEKSGEISKKRREAVAQRKDRSSTNVPTNVVQLNTQSQSQSQLQLDNTLSLKERVSGFEEFWKGYPKKVGRGGAEAAWNSAIYSGVQVGEILVGLDSYKFPTEKRFVPNPAKWLAERRWQDEQPAADFDKPKERDLRNVPDALLNNEEYWRKRKQMQEDRR